MNKFALQNAVMTTSRKNIIILFFALLAGYIAILIGVIVLADIKFFGASEIWEIAFLFLVLILIFCYPPLSISYLLYKQVGNKFSRWGIVLSLFLILGLILAMFYEFQVRIILRDHGILIYFVTLIPITSVLSYFVIGRATTKMKQKLVTKLFGGLTLLGSIGISTLLLATYLDERFLKFHTIKDILFWNNGMVFALVAVSATLALLCAVFLGLKEGEQSA